MTSYIEYAKEAGRARIKRVYAENKDNVPDELWKTPLREFTYEDTKEFVDNDGRRFLKPENLPRLLHDHIHRFKVVLSKDITLEGAVNSI